MVHRAAVDALCDAALDPPGGALTLLLGDPGSGRSHSLDAVAEQTTARGGTVLRGSTAGPHRSPLAAALTHAVIGLGGRMESRRRHLLRQIGHGTRTAPDSPQTWLNCLGGVADLLRRQSGDGVGLLLLDDLEAGDPVTAATLAALDGPARAGGDGAGTSLHVVATLRGTARAVDDVAARCGRAPIRLAPFTASEVAHLVLERLDHVPRRSLVRRLHVSSRGNPALVLAALDSWTDAGALHLVDGRAILVPDPPPVTGDAGHPLVRAVDAIGGEAALLARCCAVVGTMSVAQAQYVLDLGPDTIADAWRRLLAEGAAGTGPDATQIMPIAGELARQVLAATVGPVRRSRWHARAAQFLLRAGTAEDHRRLAHHVAHADAFLPPPQARSLLLTGAGGVDTGRQSLTLTAAAAATGPTAPHERRDLLARLVVAACRAGDVQRALAVAREMSADPECERAGIDRSPFVDLAAALLVAGRFDDLADLTRRLSWRSPRSRTGAGLAALAAAAQGGPTPADHPVGGGPAAHPAEHAAAVLRSLAHGNYAAARRAAVEHDRRVAGADPAPWPVQDLTGQVETALGEPPSGPGEAAAPLPGRLLRAVDEGRWLEALDHLHHVASGHRDASVWLAPISAPGLAAVLWCRIGRADLMLRWIARAPEATEATLARAELDLLVGEPSAALDRLARWLRAPAPASAARLETMLCLQAETAHACHDQAEVENAAARLAERAAAQPGVRHLAALAGRARSLVTADPGPALRAAAVEADLRHPFEQARCLLAAARAGAPPDVSATPARRILRGLGAMPWARLAARLEHRSAARAGDGRTPDDLELATLVTEGFTNQQIASWTALSVRTVEARLSALYLRTGCGSRTALAALLAARGPHAVAGAAIA